MARAFCLERSFPAVIFGPVLFFALRRFALIFFSEVTEINSCE
jgi:hypothetical protein